MITSPDDTRRQPRGLEKVPSGIAGIDEITFGGLPKGRPVLVCGGPGCGKTLLGMQFLVRGAVDYGEPGVFLSFEESDADISQNVSSLGWDTSNLVAQNKIRVDYVEVARDEIEETGEYDLEGLFIRLGYAIDSIGATRVVVDSIEVLFGGLQNHYILRAELRRLFHWLKSKGVTAIVTAERGEGALTRYGMEEYLADCVIVLDHRVVEQITTRHLRIVKYRGSMHGTNEYPFLIDDHGMVVFPITSVKLESEALTARVSSGVEELDAMLGGHGYYRGSSILISGAAGTGKSSFAASFVDATCRPGERCIYFALEESKSQIVRNMRSIGIDLQQWVDEGLLQFQPTRASVYGLEMHLVKMCQLIEDFKPSAVVVDPMNSLVGAGSNLDVRSMLTRLVDFLKGKQITAVFLGLTADGTQDAAGPDVGISSLMDTWVSLRNLESGGERRRGLFILKSRGMAHSNQIREFLLTDRGIDLLERR